MASLIGCPVIRFWPGGPAPTLGTTTLNQATDALEFVFQVPDAITITRVGTRQGTVTGTSPAYKWSLQGVDASGNPDGTIKGGGSPASVVATPAGVGNNTWISRTLDNAYAASRGERLALVIKHDSGTIDGSNSCSFAGTGGVGLDPGMPYCIQNDNGTRARQTTAALFGYGSASVAYGLPASAVINASFTNASTPDEKALLFNLPTTLLSTYRVIGACVTGVFAAAGTFDLALYDTNGTSVLAQTTFDTDVDRNVAGARTRPFYFDDSPALLSAGSPYRLSLIASATSATLVGVTVDADADMDAYPWGGAVAKSSSRSDAGAWTDDPKTRFGIDLILSDITLPAASGALMRLGMQGGFNA